MKKLGLLILNFSIMILALGLACVTDQNKSRAKSSSDHYTCEQDTDCVLVKKNCCSCSASGAREALNKSGQKAKLEQLASECGDIMCAQMISQDPSCDKGAEATCENSKCSLKSK